MSHIPKFHFSSYWNMWSRVIATNHIAGQVVEFSLTPLNMLFAPKGAWRDEVGQIEIRAHNTVPQPRDKFTDELPDEIKARLVENLGEALVDRLLNDDILSEIDWKRYRELNLPGGTPLHLVRKAS